MLLTFFLEGFLFFFLAVMLVRRFKVEESFCEVCDIVRGEKFAVKGSRFHIYRNMFFNCNFLKYSSC